MIQIEKKILLRFWDLYLYLEEHLGCGGHCLDNALLEMSALVKPYLKKSLSAPLVESWLFWSWRIVRAAKAEVKAVSARLLTFNFGFWNWAWKNSGDSFSNNLPPILFAATETFLAKLSPKLIALVTEFLVTIPRMFCPTLGISPCRVLKPRMEFAENI